MESKAGEYNSGAKIKRSTFIDTYNDLCSFDFCLCTTGNVNIYWLFKATPVIRSSVEISTFTPTPVKSQSNQTVKCSEGVCTGRTVPDGDRWYDSDELKLPGHRERLPRLSWPSVIDGSIHARRVQRPCGTRQQQLGSHRCLC